MNPTQLAGLIKRAYPNFDMTNFDDRLKLQKFVYLIQSCGLNLGYDFKLYLHGPYATQLARDGFDMPNFSNCNCLKFEDSKSEKILIDLLDFLKNKKDDTDNMEILASLHFFHDLFPSKSEKELIEMVKEKNSKFLEKDKDILNMLIEFKKFKIIKW